MKEESIFALFKDRAGQEHKGKVKQQTVIEMGKRNKNL